MRPLACVTLLIVLLLEAARCQDWIVGSPTQMSNIRRVRVRGDYRSAVTTGERQQWVRDGGINDGAVFYLPWASASNVTAKLYREDNGNGVHYRDSMDSPSPGEGGYHTEGIIGVPWTVQKYPWLLPLRRYRDTVTNDHGSFGYVVDGPQYDAPLPNYVGEEILGWGYRRWFNTALVPQAVSSSRLSVTCNAAAGGAVWEYLYSAGDGAAVQFVNSHDTGRLMQAAMFLYSSTSPGSMQFVNPTEAGDCLAAGCAAGPATADPQDYHGSPLAGYWTSGNASSPVVHTRAVPLAWSPNGGDTAMGGATEFSFGIDGDPNPVAFVDMLIGKDMELEYRGMPKVARYTTTLQYPSPIQFAALQIPALYLRPNFNNISIYDAPSGKLVPQPQAGACNSDMIWSAFGDNQAPSYPLTCGGILASAGIGHTIGIFGCTAAHGGDVTHLTATNWACGNGGDGPGSIDTVALSAWRNWNPAYFEQPYAPVPNLPGTSANYTSYIVVGDSIADAAMQMSQLYHSMGEKSGKDSRRKVNREESEIDACSNHR